MEGLANANFCVLRLRDTKQPKKSRIAAMGPHPLNEPGPNLRMKPSETPVLQKVHKNQLFKHPPPVCLGNSFPAESSNLTGLWHINSAGGKSSWFPDLPGRGERNRLLHLTGDYPLQEELENLT